MTTACACGCGRPITRQRPGAKYAMPACRAKASRKRRSGIPGAVRSIRRLKSGKVSLIIHVMPLWSAEAYVRLRGDNVRVVEL